MRLGIPCLTASSLSLPCRPLTPLRLPSGSRRRLGGQPGSNGLSSSLSSSDLRSLLRCLGWGEAGGGRESRGAIVLHKRVVLLLLLLLLLVRRRGGAIAIGASLWGPRKAVARPWLAAKHGPWRWRTWGGSSSSEGAPPWCLRR